MSNKKILLLVTGFLILNVCVFWNILDSHVAFTFNDYNIPMSLSELKTYLSNISIYNANKALGGMRINFGIEIIPLLFIFFLSLFMPYIWATKLFYIIGFLIIEMVFFVIFKKLSKSDLVSFCLSLSVVFNLWSFDRIQQGHYLNLMFFLPVAGFFIYYLYYSKSKNKYYFLAIFLFLGMITYYHYTFILFYLLGVDFIYKIITRKDKFKLTYEHIKLSVIFLLLLSMFIFPYFFIRSEFSGLASSVSSTNAIHLFSWQSTLLSSFFHLRTGMSSYSILNAFTLFLYMFGINILYVMWIFKKRITTKHIRIDIVILILFFLSFGLWLFPDFVENIVYKIPTMSVFRDMNKFIGIVFMLILFLIASKKVVNKWLIIIATLCIIYPIISSQFYFSPTFEHSSFDIKTYDTSEYSVISFPSYPIYYIKSHGNTYHSYLPVLSSGNNTKSVALPFSYQNDFSALERRLFFKKLYIEWNKLTKRELYREMSLYGIKYIYFYKHLPFWAGGNMASWYKKIDVEDKFDNVNKIFEDDKIIVYKIPDEYFVNTINTSDKIAQIDSKRQSHVKLNVKITKLTKKIDIVFLENYSPLWNIYLGNSMLFKETHIVAHNWSNKWIIDPEYIKQNFSKEYYKENPDGSIDVELTLYFKPQSYFYLGLLISGTTFISLTGYLIYDWRKRKKLLKNDNSVKKYV